MTTKEYLCSVKRLENMINDKLDEIYRVKTRATNITVPCDKERVDGTPCTDRMGEQVTDIVEMEKDVDLLTDFLVDIKKNIVRMCATLNPSQANVVIKHYVECNSFSQTADICGFKIGKTKKLCREAEIELEKQYGNAICRYTLDSNRYIW